MPLYPYPPYTTEATATGDITTTSGTPVLATGMTISPDPGTYEVWFNASTEHSSNRHTVYLSIYVGGVLAMASERPIFHHTKNDTRGGSTHAKVTVASGEAIEGRWSVSGGTGTMHDRSLMILETYD